jgi:hypothetical protein
MIKVVFGGIIRTEPFQHVIVTCTRGLFDGRPADERALVFNLYLSLASSLNVKIGYRSVWIRASTEAKICPFLISLLRVITYLPDQMPSGILAGCLLAKNDCVTSL